MPGKDDIPCGREAGCGGVGPLGGAMSIGTSPESASSMESAESSERLSTGRLAEREVEPVDVMEFQSLAEETMEARGAQSGLVGGSGACGGCARAGTVEEIEL